jgi:D-glycero-beta-D-manno-heptose-7-phosphate kinase
MPGTTAAPLDADFLECLEREAATRSVLIVGDVLLDEYVFGDVKRISPEAPVQVVEFRSRRHLPGGAANVAANIAALGCRPLLGGVVGTDREGDLLREALADFSVNSTGLVHDATRPTTVKLRILGHNQQIVRLDREVRTPLAAAVEEALLAWIGQHVHEAHACVLSDYGKGVLSARLASRVIDMCHKAGVPTFVDPKSLEVGALHGATLVKPNKGEAERLAQREIGQDAGFLEVGQQLAAALRGTAILITRGPLGMSLFRHGAEPMHVPTVARNVYDVTGAGDTVISMVAVATAAGATLEQAVHLANLSAAIAVEKLGTGTVSFGELKARATISLNPNGAC